MFCLVLQTRWIICSDNSSYSLWYEFIVGSVVQVCAIEISIPIEFSEIMDKNIKTKLWSWLVRVKLSIQSRQSVIRILFPQQKTRFSVILSAFPCYVLSYINSGPCFAIAIALKIKRIIYVYIYYDIKLYVLSLFVL